MINTNSRGNKLWSAVYSHEYALSNHRKRSIYNAKGNLPVPSSLMNPFLSPGPMGMSGGRFSFTGGKTGYTSGSNGKIMVPGGNWRFSSSTGGGQVNGRQTNAGRITMGKAGHTWSSGGNMGTSGGMSNMGYTSTQGGQKTGQTNNLGGQQGTITSSMGQTGTSGGQSSKLGNMMTFI